ncbi:MAG: hypothetical protein JW774_06745 [Candidatus Aureabacteria bacterium]|nr:hypothetical protein [Candidatus Auribacterota bacterium]
MNFSAIPITIVFIWLCYVPLSWCADEHVYGAKWEPLDGKILHGAGQDPASFFEYGKALSPNRPLLYMEYLNLAADDENTLSEKLKSYSSGDPFLIPQIGISFSSIETQVIEGLKDPLIRKIALCLKGTQSPVFIRPGYEFNGSWNNYEPRAFIRAYQKIVDIFRQEKADNAAFVWCFAADGEEDFMSYYPGDAYADWWGIDLFSADHLFEDKTVSFLDAAHQHRKPVMIGESTPRETGTLNGSGSWDQWFKPYFQFIRSHPQIKAFCYINWNWPYWADLYQTDWHHWGDARIQMNQDVLSAYREEMNRPCYLHASKREVILDQLNR